MSRILYVARNENRGSAGFLDEPLGLLGVFVLVEIGD
jgi:hypothetical protein